MSYTNQKKVIVGMSGGVDSSVAAYLLLQQNYNVEGLFMKNWEQDNNDATCSIAADLADAQAVCDTLCIKLHKVNFAAEYWDNVFENFLEQYKIGRTPNPDILCNKKIKFETFLEFAIDELGADFIATGHHVRKKDVNNKSILLRGIDEKKDQSYFLYTLNQEQIKKSLFPIGNFKKIEVRRLAKVINLINFEKKDSTGICFIGKRKFQDFLKCYLPEKPGQIENTDGEIIGKHSGVIYYTLGQRKGLGIGGLKNNANNPWYVVDKDTIRNRLIVAQGKLNPKLLSSGLIAKNLYWINGKCLNQSLKCTTKIRYHQSDIPCKIVPHSSDIIEVIFDEPVIAVTPGQSAVFYSGDICLGGGIIEHRLLI